MEETDQMPERNKILITGSSGMLGIDLCQELAEDCEIIGTDLLTSHTSRVTSFFKSDITNREAIAKIIALVKPDVVIHTAAMTDVDGCESAGEKAYKINAEGAGNVAGACRSAGAVLIHISTDFIFDGKKRAPYTEEDKPSPLSVYGDSKLKGEEAIKKEAEEYFILRTSWLYGKHGKNFVDTIIAKAKTEKVLKVVDGQVGSPTYTVDLAKAIHTLLDKVTGYGTYHVSNSGSVSWYGYAKEILRLSGSKTEVIAISSKELDRPAERPAMSILDNSKFAGFTGYKLRDWKDALKEYLPGDQ